MPRSSHRKSILYVRAASLADLCRACSNLDFTADNLFLQRLPRGARLMAFGESIGNVMMAYYIDAKPSTNLIMYSLPVSGYGREEAGFVSRAEQQPGHYITIIDLNLDRFKEAKNTRKNDPNIVKMGDSRSIINAVIKKSVRDERLMHLYCFRSGGKVVLSGFDLIDELADDTRTFYYAFADDRALESSFARYDYINNKVDFTSTVGEHSYMYTKLIKLAEPFPFFKMPE